MHLDFKYMKNIIFINVTESFLIEFALTLVSCNNEVWLVHKRGGGGQQNIENNILIPFPDVGPSYFISCFLIILILIVSCFLLLLLLQFFISRTGRAPISDRRYGYLTGGLVMLNVPWRCHTMSTIGDLQKDWSYWKEQRNESKTKTTQP